MDRIPVLIVVALFMASAVITIKTEAAGERHRGGRHRHLLVEYRYRRKVIVTDCMFRSAARRIRPRRSSLLSPTWILLGFLLAGKTGPDCPLSRGLIRSGVGLYLGQCAPPH
jgi:hypothetical protein